MASWAGKPPRGGDTTDDTSFFDSCKRLASYRKALNDHFQFPFSLVFLSTKGV
jgi:hypothetical protein